MKNKVNYMEAVHLGSEYVTDRLFARPSMECSCTYFSCIKRTIENDYVKVFSVDTGLLMTELSSKSLLVEYIKYKDGLKEVNGDVESFKFTSLAWWDEPQEKSAKRKRKTKSAKSRLPLLMLGTSTGLLFFVSPVDGGIVKCYVSHSSNAICDITSCLSMVCFGTKDGFVYKLDLEKETVIPFKTELDSIENLSISGDMAFLLVSYSSSLLCYRMDNNQLTSYPVCISPIRELKFFPESSDNFVVTCFNERVSTVYSTENTENVFSISTDTNVLSINIEGSTKYISSLSEDGIVHVWSYGGLLDDGENEGVLSSNHPASKICVKNSDNDIIEILYSKLTVKNNVPYVFIVYGNLIKLYFEAVRLLDECGNATKSVELHRNILSSYITTDPKKKQVDAVEDVDFNVEVDDNIPFIASGPQEETIPDEELERIIQKSIVELREKRDLKQIHLENVSLEDMNLQLYETIKLRDMITSLTNSHDRRQMERVLGSINDDILMEGVVTQLDISDVISFFTFITDIFCTNQESAHMLKWIHTCLNVHSGLIMTIPDMSGKFGLFYKSMCTRASSYKKLLELVGRIDLVLCLSKSQTGEEQKRIDTPSQTYIDN